MTTVMHILLLASLTAVGVPVATLAEATVDFLAQALSARERGKEVTQEITLDCQIVVRESTAPREVG